MKKVVVVFLAMFSVMITKTNAQDQPVSTQAQPQNTQNQAFKIGYTNVSYLLSVSPESRQIQQELQDYEGQLTRQMEAKARTFQDKVTAFQQDVAAFEQGKATTTEAQLKKRQEDLMREDGELKRFQQNADSSLQARQFKLLAPVTEKISKAIKDVANEAGYTYVFNSDAGMGTTQILLHAPEGDNITDLVIKKLGINPSAVNAAAPAKTTTAKPAPAKPAPAKTAPAPNKKKP